MSTPASTLLCTVGTSLFFPNLAGLKADDPDPNRARLAAAFANRDADGIAKILATFSMEDRLVGAELNSNALLLSRGLVTPDPNLYICHSDTDDGRLIAEILVKTYKQRGLSHVEAVPITDLQDADPQRFRTHGLRHLARSVCRLLRAHDPSSCAINATGGYKAQIAVAVMMGQALGVPVYYKHERFNDIIAFPPMPVALDFEAWLKLSSVLYALDRESLSPIDALDDLPDLVESELGRTLFDREAIDGRDHLALSPTGQIFHETFRHRFGRIGADLLPPPAAPDRKREPRIEDGHTRDVRGLKDFLTRLTNEVPQVVSCETWYSHPNLPRPQKFWVNPKGLVGQYGDGRGLAKFRVESTATTEAQTLALAAALNEWLEREYR